MLCSRPPKSPTISHKRAAAINVENREQSRYPLEAWSPFREGISTEFYLVASMQALDRLKDLKSENTRHNERGKFALIAQINNLVSCADPSGGLAERVRQILSNPKYRGTPSAEWKLSPIQKNMVVNRTGSIWPDTLGAPIPPKTPHISPTQEIQQLCPTGHNHLHGPLFPPSLIASKNEACWRLEGVETPKRNEKPPEALPKKFRWMGNPAINLASSPDLCKPVILDYLPIRDIPKEDSSRNLNLTEASEIFQWTNVYRCTALDIVNSFKNLASSNASAMPQGNSWIPLSYPRARFVRDMHANFKRLYGESSWNGAEIMRLPNTCKRCRSLTTDSLPKPSRILDDTEGPLLHFSIRFDGIKAVLQDFPRQIVVPPFDDLSTQTGFEASSEFKFSWLRWNQVRQGFLGTVPESLFTDAHTKGISQVQSPFTVDLPVIARTVTAFSTGVQCEARVSAQVKIRIFKYLSVQNTHTPEGKIAKSFSTIGPIPKPTGPNSTPDHTEDAERSPTKN
ncbi:hypothetical protein HOY80DRAFT_1085429 [Tuber brumale]|nr:hypothetical protein HOY80DRAFT_1085429 [Tuber brumale]